MVEYDGACSGCSICEDVAAVVPAYNTDNVASCLVDIVPVAYTAVNACLDENNELACMASGCQEAVAAVNTHIQDTCAGVDVAAYEPALQTLLDAVEGFQPYCLADSCVFLYNEIFNNCLPLSETCDSSACADAFANAQELSATCQFADVTADEPYNIADLGELVQSYVDIQTIECAGCSAAEMEGACVDVETGFMACDGEDSPCGLASTAFFTSLVEPSITSSSCGPVYTAANYGEILPQIIEAQTNLHLLCTGDLSIINANEDMSADAVDCVNVHANAVNVCGMAGISIIDPVRCNYPSCYTAVNHLVEMHDMCIEAHEEVETDWVLEAGEYALIMATNTCPCMDHTLNQYAINMNGFSGMESTSCSDLAINGLCNLDLGAFSPLLAGQLPAHEVCCMSCQTADNSCEDMSLCSPDSPMSNIISLPAMCELPIGDILPGHLGGNTFSNACPFTCGTCYNFDECTSSPCQNGAECVDLYDEYECICTDGYQGDECDTVIPEDCSGDINGDGEINVSDMLVVLAQFGETTTYGDVVAPVNVVDVEDLLAVASVFGDSC